MAINLFVVLYGKKTIEQNSAQKKISLRLIIKKSIGRKKIYLQFEIKKKLTQRWQAVYLRRSFFE